MHEGRGNGGKGVTLDEDAAKALVRQGQEAGFLTQEEVALALDELELDTVQIDEFYKQLDELHIEVVESEPEEEEPTSAQPDAAEVSTDSSVPQRHRQSCRSSRQRRKSSSKWTMRRPPREAAAGRGEPRLVVSIAKNHRNQIALPRPSRRGRSAPRCREVRLPQGCLHLRDVVDRARALADKARTIRMPVHVVEKLNKIGRVERKLLAELGHDPTADEIARELEIEREEVEQIRRSAQTPISLEKPVGDEEESEFGHFLADQLATAPDEAAETTLRKETLKRILCALSPRERRVLELRYGLDGQHPRTLDEVGRTFHVTRERVRQIENQSLKKLQALAESQKLRDVAA